MKHGMMELRRLAAEAGMKLVKEKKHVVKLNRKEKAKIQARLTLDGLAIVVKRNGGPCKVFSRKGFEAAVSNAHKCKPWKNKREKAK